MKLENELKVGLESIADIVRKFPESLHLRVFDLIVGSLGRGPHTQPGASSSVKSEANISREPVRKAKAERKAGKKAKSAAQVNRAPKRITDLDLGHVSQADSFAKFAEEKGPKSNSEFNTVALYYLTEQKQIANIKMDHIYTCYDAANRPVPEAFAQSIRDTASRYGYIDISDWDNLQLGVKGRNLVKHDLPRLSSKE